MYLRPLTPELEPLTPLFFPPPAPTFFDSDTFVYSVLISAATF